MKKTILAATLAIALSPIGASASEPESPNVFVQALDLVLVRPLSLAAATLSSVAFVVSSPVLIAADNVFMGYDVMVGIPMDYTFSRPLGQWQ